MNAVVRAFGKRPDWRELFAVCSTSNSVLFKVSKEVRRYDLGMKMCSIYREAGKVDVMLEVESVWVWGQRCKAIT